MSLQYPMTESHDDIGHVAASAGVPSLTADTWQALTQRDLSELCHAPAPYRPPATLLRRVRVVR